MAARKRGDDLVQGAQAAAPEDVADDLGADLPERDPARPSRDQGLYQKYAVHPIPPGTTLITPGAGITPRLAAGAVVIQRTDRRPISWCFILESGDPLAIPALIAYENTARMAGRGPLADDLFDQVERQVDALGGWGALAEEIGFYKGAHEASREYREAAREGRRPRLPKGAPEAAGVAEATAKTAAAALMAPDDGPPAPPPGEAGH